MDCLLRSHAGVLVLALVLLAVAPLLAHIALGVRSPGWLLIVGLLTPMAVAVLAAAWLSQRGG